MRLLRSLQALLLASLLPACMVEAIGDDDSTGDDSTGDDSGDDDGTDPDPMATCAVPASLPGSMTGAAAVRLNQSGSMGALHTFRLQGKFDAATPFDAFSLELWDQSGVFTAAVAPGTYTIAGAETSLATCGACVLALGDVDATGAPDQVYLAESGTVTITTVEPTLAGTLSNIVLTQIDTTGARVADGCSTQLPALSFSAPVTIQDGDGTGGGGGGGGG